MNRKEAVDAELTADLGYSDKAFTRMVMESLNRRCLGCKMFDGGKCPNQVGIVRVCAKEEINRLRTARNIAAPPKPKPAPMTWASGMTKGVSGIALPPLGIAPPPLPDITTQDELDEFLVNNPHWRELCADLEGRLPTSELAHILRLEYPEAKSEPPKPMVSAEDAGFLERLKLKVKANYAQHKDMLRDFLDYAREHGFELRTETGVKAVSDEQHILGFSGETLPMGDFMTK